MLNLNLGARMRWARSLAHDARVGLVVNPSVKIPCTDGRTIYMPALSNEWKDGEMDLAVWDGVLWHEVCHLRHPEDFDLLKRLQLPREDPRGMLLNIVVDHNIELAEYGRLSGRDILTDSAVRWACRYFKAAPDQANPTTHKVLAAQAFSLRARLHWTQHLDPTDVAVPLSPASQTWLDRLLNEPGLLDRLATLRDDGEPNWELAQQISRLLHLDPDQQEEPEPDQGGEESGPSESGKGQPSDPGEPGEEPESGSGEEGEDAENNPSSSPGDQPGEKQDEAAPGDQPAPGDQSGQPEPETAEEGEPSPGRGEGQPDDSTPPAPGAEQVPGADDAGDEERQAERDALAPREVDYREIEESTGQLTPVHVDQLDQVRQIKITGYQSRRSGSSYYIPMEPVRKKITGPEAATVDPHVRRKVHELVDGATLQKAIRREMQALNQVAWEGNKTRGRLNRRQIGGIACKLAPRPFQQRRQQQMLNTAISLLVDTSGSMQGAAYYHAAAAAILMADCFSSLGIATEIIGFTGFRKRATFFLHKEFSEHRPTVDSLVASFVWAGNMMGNTPDGESTVFALSRLAQRKERRKMIFTLTDGSPSFPENKTGDCAEFTQRVIQSLEANPRYEIYGIGLMDDNVTRLYKEHLVIDNVKELESGLLTLIRNKILKNT